MKYFIYAGIAGIITAQMLFVVYAVSLWIAKNKSSELSRRIRYGLYGMIIAMGELMVLNLYKTGAAYQKYRQIVELHEEQTRMLEDIKKGQEELSQLLEKAKNTADVLGEVLPDWAEELKKNSVEK